MMVCSASWAEWEITSALGGSKVIHYHDKSTIQQDGAIAKMWLMYDYLSVQIDRKSNMYRSEKIFVVFDCSEQKFTSISGVLYAGPFGGGKAISLPTIKESDAEWYPVFSGSAVWRELIIACGKQ